MWRFQGTVYRGISLKDLMWHGFKKLQNFPKWYNYYITICKYFINIFCLKTGFRNSVTLKPAIHDIPWTCPMPTHHQTEKQKHAGQSNNFWWFLNPLSSSDSRAPKYFSAGVGPQSMQYNPGAVCGTHLLLIHAERISHTPHQPAQQNQWAQRGRVELCVSCNNSSWTLESLKKLLKL